MFTGLVQALASVVDVRDEPPGKRLVVREPLLAAACSVGESVAVSGCCLTVVAVQKDTLAFEAGPETLRRTSLGQLKPGSRVNLERSLRLGDPLGGHFVTGHIDGLGAVAQRLDEQGWSTVWFQAAGGLLRQIVPKGSVAVDGVSLTVVDVRDDRFSVQLIPHTLAVTTLGLLQTGDPVNLETDLLAKYAQKMEERGERREERKDGPWP